MCVEGLEVVFCYWDVLDSEAIAFMEGLGDMFDSLYVLGSWSPAHVLCVCGKFF